MNEPIKEKVLSGKKIGMPVLFFTVLLYLAAIGLTIYGAVLAEEGGSPLLMIVGIVWLCIGWLPAPGLKVLKPQEALVLTLFGKYYGYVQVNDSMTFAQLLLEYADVAVVPGSAFCSEGFCRKHLRFSDN